MVFATVLTPAARQLGAVEARRMLLVYAPITVVAANRVAAATYRPRVRAPLDGIAVEDRQRSVVEYLRFPVLALGAGLLGIAAARWLPRPGVLPLVLVVLVVSFLTLYQDTDTDVVHGRVWFVLWQEVWHLVYLLGLGVLAGIATLLRTGGPRRPLWGVAAVAAVAVVVTAAAADLARRRDRR